MELISLHIKIPIELKRYLKHIAVDKDTTITDYVTELIVRDKEQRERGEK